MSETLAPEHTDYLSRAMELFEQHCRVFGHKTQAQAMDEGLRPDDRKYATYNLARSRSLVGCNLCGWREPVTR